MVRACMWLWLVMVLVTTDSFSVAVAMRMLARAALTRAEAWFATAECVCSAADCAVSVCPLRYEDEEPPEVDAPAPPLALQRPARANPTPAFTVAEWVELPPCCIW